MSNRLLPVLALVIAAGIFFGYVNPTWTGSISSVQSEIASYDSALASAGQYQQKQDQLLQEKNAIPADKLARLSTLLPDSVNNVQLILDLDALAARTGVALSNFDTQSSAASGASASAAPAAAGAIALSSSPVDSLTVSLAATATYGAFRQFLAGLEQSERLLDVTDVEISPSTTGVYDYKLTLRLYWLR
ncbi:MAG: hypothetical protein KGI41_01950 [Patescibacteria group bacterium]|nr:hypothetical protein [Patescibacteria group bacterium]